MTDALSFSRKLMRINQRALRSNAPRAIFGSIGDLPQALSTRAAFRLAMWSCISEEQPEIAMGLWMALAHLLERWRDIEVYRIFAKLEDDFVWSMDKSQISPEEFELEPLDENVRVWGKLEKNGAEWQLTANLDKDLLTGEDNDTVTLNISAANPIDFFAKLPAFAAQIAENLGAISQDESDLAYQADDLRDNADLRELLVKLLRWEVSLIASLWGIEWEDVDFEDDFDGLLDSGEKTNNDFAAWMISKAVAQTMRPGYSVFGDLLVKRVRDVVETFPNSYFPAPILANAIFFMGFVPNSHKLLQDEIAAHPQNVIARLNLAQQHGLTGNLAEAIEIFQTAIEEEVTNKQMFRAYGNVLVAADQYSEVVDSFILIDLADYEEDYLLWEAIAAYTEVLNEDPNDMRALYSRLMQRVALGANDAELWQDFQKILTVDIKGEFIGDAIEAMYDLGDVSEGVNQIAAMLEKEPKRVDLLINLAALYLVNEEEENAEAALEKAKVIAIENSDLAEIERLLLVAKDAEFEQRFAELTGIVEAGNELSADDVEFLEDAADNAPHYLPVHLALARAYYLWEDTNEALEVLLEIQESTPDDIEVLLLLSQILWEADEKESAMNYLNRGMAKYPFNVSLIAQTGKFLFENAQYQDSKAYLARAEEIAPQNPALQAVRAFIARQIAENPSIAAAVAANAD